MSDQPLPWTIEESPAEVVLAFDARVYSLEAVERAMYWMTDRCFVLVEKDAPGDRIRARMTAKNSESMRTLAGELGNRVLDEELRRQILAETRPIREAIVEQAFAEADLGDNRGATFADDPEHIGPS